MGKFKVGDRVRQKARTELESGLLVKHWNDYWAHHHGKLVDDSFVITRVCGHSNGEYYIYSSNFNGEGPQIDEKYIELVTETPQPSFVKLIPEQVIPARREIIDSVVQIGGVDAIYINKYSKTEKPCCMTEIGIETNMIFTADDLREASNVFLELASILEENAK